MEITLEMFRCFGWNAYSRISLLCILGFLSDVNREVTPRMLLTIDLRLERNKEKTILVPVPNFTVEEMYPSKIVL